MIVLEDLVCVCVCGYRSNLLSVSSRRIIYTRNININQMNLKTLPVYEGNKYSGG